MSCLSHLRRGGIGFLAWQVNLANGAKPCLNRCLVLSRIRGIQTLRQIRHFHSKYQDGHSENGEDANHKGIHVKKLLVALQGVAPEN
jgi:hypothetical protein